MGRALKRVARFVPKNCDMILADNREPGGKKHFLRHKEAAHFKSEVFKSCPCTPDQRQCPLEAMGKKSIHAWFDYHGKRVPGWPFKVEFVCKKSCAPYRHVHKSWTSRNHLSQRRIQEASTAQKMNGKEESVVEEVSGEETDDEEEEEEDEQEDDKDESDQQTEESDENFDEESVNGIEETDNEAKKRKRMETDDSDSEVTAANRLPANGTSAKKIRTLKRLSSKEMTKKKAQNPTVVESPRKNESGFNSFFSKVKNFFGII